MLSWKEGRDLYLLILFGIGVALVEGFLFLSSDGWGRGGRGGDGEPGGGPSVAELMAGAPDDSLYARVEGPRPFVFPDDHGPHPEFRTEWWYVTSSLEGEDGRLFGAQFTLFRNAVSPTLPGRDSFWNTNQVYLGHFAVTDVEGDRHYHGERFARGAGGLAGALADPFRVWLEGWELRSLRSGKGETAQGVPVAAGAGDPTDIFPLHLHASHDEVELTLRLDPGRPAVLQGEDGYSRKGAEPGNASYYISFTRMPSSGTLRIGDVVHTVSGLAWMDREWSTSALSQGQVGWDWFSLQLDDGRDLMFYQIRQEDASPDPLSKGRIVEPDGSSRALGLEEWELEVTGEWASPLDGARYPSGWRFRVPREELDLEIIPLVRDQEMRVTFRYWEGAVLVRNRLRGEEEFGRGFVELTGYADRREEDDPVTRGR